MRKQTRLLSGLLTAALVAGSFGSIPAKADTINGWEVVDGNWYWYENGVKQGTEGRGKEIYDPDSDAWYWLDAVDGGKKATSKDLYQESDAGVWAEERGKGKWVRYDEKGHMIKGWYTNENGTYYFDPVYGTMAKGYAVLDEQLYHFDEATGIGGTSNWDGVNGWVVIDGNEFWYENGIRQGTEGRGKEIYDPGSDAWYWLDAVDGGKKAVSKDVFQESAAGEWAEGADGTGKWVRYDEFGHMIKGWSTTENGTYYFDPVYGTMAKGLCIIDGREYNFDSANGVCTNDVTIPTATPEAMPTAEPTPAPTAVPTIAPTVTPTDEPTSTLPPFVNEEDVVHEGQIGQVRWVITNEGQLIIVGTCGIEQQNGWVTRGAYNYTTHSFQYNLNGVQDGEWLAHREEITSAYVSLNAPTNLSGLFMGLNKLKKIDFGQADAGWNINTGDVSSFDTSSVTSMFDMFHGCSSLTDLDLSSFDTSSVTNMSYMFHGCSSLTDLDLSSFDTSSVTNMGCMFNGCSNLSNLDLSSFDTSSVTNMFSIFSNCSSLTDLDLSSFDTSSVADMSSMFYYCNSLTDLDLSSFDTSSMVRMYGMFDDCSSLTDLDLSSFDTSAVADMSSIFSGCSSLTDLDLSSFDTSSVTHMRHMFSDCSSLTEILVDSKWQINSNIDTSYMFTNCGTDHVTYKE